MRQGRLVGDTRKGREGEERKGSALSKLSGTLYDALSRSVEKVTHTRPKGSD